MEYSKTPLEVLRETRRQYMRELCLLEAEIQRREASSVPEPDIVATKSKAAFDIDNTRV